MFTTKLRKELSATLTESKSVDPPQEEGVGGEENVLHLLHDLGPGRVTVELRTKTILPPSVTLREKVRNSKLVRNIVGILASRHDIILKTEDPITKLPRTNVLGNLSWSKFLNWAEPERGRGARRSFHNPYSSPLL